MPPDPGTAMVEGVILVVTMRTLWERWSGSGSRASGDNAEPYLMYFCQVVEVEG